MKYAMLICLLTLSGVHSVYAQYRRENLSLDAPSVASQSRYKFENLQLYPIRANKGFEAHQKDLANYVTLKDALEKKKVAITESSASGTVNTLLLENISRDTIILLAGEVVQGGKQDRVIGEDIVLYPKSGKKAVSVFCVEHGRWDRNGGDGSFRNYFALCTKEVRKAAAVNKDQREVWDKVRETTEKNQASTSTGTLAALQNSDSFNKDLDRYMKHFGNLFKTQADVIGVVAVSGKNILGCDMFISHEIFAKYFDGLLNSYATEAITSGEGVTVSYDRVRQYLDAIISDEARQEKELEKKGTMLRDGGKKIHVSTFE